jgi:hypothetical protein
MARFYGSIKSMRGFVTHRLAGSVGMPVIVAGWQGGVRTRIFDKDGEDWVRIEHIKWVGAGVEKLIYEGPVAPKRKRRK